VGKRTCPEKERCPAPPVFILTTCGLLLSVFILCAGLQNNSTILHFVNDILGLPVSKPSPLTTSATDGLPRRLSEQGFPMRLPVRLETTVRTENRTAGAVPDALYALKGATLLSTPSAI